MPRIINVHPGQGQIDDKIVIDVDYNPPANPGVPNVNHVVFYNNVDAPSFNVLRADAANHTLTLNVRVPNDAITGPIEIDVDGEPPIRTIANFTVTHPNPAPVTVTQIIPPMGPGYPRGSRMTVRLSVALGIRITGVYFPRSDYGPANLPGQFTQSQGPVQCVINSIPAATASHGRVKIAMGPTAVFTRILTFT